MTYYEVFAAVQKLSPAYWTLAKQFIGVTLNELAGAPIPGDTQSYMIYVAAQFSQNTPEQIAAMKITDHTTWQYLIDIAGYLESYNKGKEGVPKCK